MNIVWPASKPAVPATKALPSPAQGAVIVRDWSSPECAARDWETGSWITCGEEYEGPEPITTAEIFWWAFWTGAVGLVLILPFAVIRAGGVLADRIRPILRRRQSGGR